MPEEGTKSQSTENYKVTVGQPISRKLDVEVWDKLKGKIDPALHPVKTKVEADALRVQKALNEDVAALHDEMKVRREQLINRICG